MSRNWKIVGHRGYAAKYPENTLAGFYAAADLGVDALELDVQISRDGVPIVIHDDTLERTSNSVGSVHLHTLDQLRHASCHFPNKFGETFNPQYLSSLESICDELSQLNCFVFVEVKKESIDFFGAEPFLEKVLLSTRSLGKRQAIISFDFNFLEILRKQSKLAIGWCIEHYDNDTLEKAKELCPDILISDINFLPAEKQNLWQGPWQWFVYGVETLKQVENLVARGVFWIEADDPSVFVETQS